MASEWLADRVLDTVDRLLGDPNERLASKIADAIRGTVNGTVAVALAEAAIIGIGFVLAGVPHPLLFAVLTMAFAMLPFGAWAAFTAAALVLLFHGGSLLAAAGVVGGLWEAVTAMFTRSRPTSLESEDFSAELAGRLKKVSCEV